MYMYLKFEADLFTVGCYAVGEWIPESDHTTRESAASRVNFLNGGKGERFPNSGGMVKPKKENTAEPCGHTHHFGFGAYECELPAGHAGLHQRGENTWYSVFAHEEDK